LALLHRLLNQPLMRPEEGVRREPRLGALKKIVPRLQDILFKRA